MSRTWQPRRVSTPTELTTSSCSNKAYKRVIRAISARRKSLSRSSTKIRRLVRRPGKPKKMIGELGLIRKNSSNHKGSQRRILKNLTFRIRMLGGSIQRRRSKDSSQSPRLSEECLLLFTEKTPIRSHLATLILIKPPKKHFK